MAGKVGRRVADPDDDQREKQELASYGVHTMQAHDSTQWDHDDDQTGGAGSKDILDNVERNSGTGKPGAIRYGID